MNNEFLVHILKSSKFITSFFSSSFITEFRSCIISFSSFDFNFCRKFGMFENELNCILSSFDIICFTEFTMFSRFVKISWLSTFSILFFNIKSIILEYHELFLVQKFLLEGIYIKSTLFKNSSIFFFSSSS